MRLWLALFAVLVVSAPVVAQVGPDAGIRDAVRAESVGGRKAADWISTGIVAGALLVPCLRTRTWQCVANEALQVGVGVASAEVTKRLTHRQRPNGRDHLSSFSEHTTIACVATLASKAWEICPAVAYLRLVADEHWATDTFAGGAVAIAIVAGLHWGH